MDGIRLQSGSPSCQEVQASAQSIRIPLLNCRLCKNVKVHGCPPNMSWNDYFRLKMLQAQKYSLKWKDYVCFANRCRKFKLNKSSKTLARIFTKCRLVSARSSTHTYTLYVNRLAHPFSNSRVGLPAKKKKKRERDHKHKNIKLCVFLYHKKAKVRINNWTNSAEEKLKTTQSVGTPV